MRRLLAILVCLYLIDPSYAGIWSQSNDAVSTTEHDSIGKITHYSTQAVSAAKGHIHNLIIDPLHSLIHPRPVVTKTGWIANVLVNSGGLVAAATQVASAVSIGLSLYPPIGASMAAIGAGSGLALTGLPLLVGFLQGSSAAGLVTGWTGHLLEGWEHARITEHRLHHAQLMLQVVPITILTLASTFMTCGTLMMLLLGRKVRHLSVLCGGSAAVACWGALLLYAFQFKRSAWEIAGDIVRDTRGIVMWFTLLFICVKIFSFILARSPQRTHAPALPFSHAHGD